MTTCTARRSATLHAGSDTILSTFARLAFIIGAVAFAIAIRNGCTALSF